MTLKSDVIYLIDEYIARFGTPPSALIGSSFPSRNEWDRIVMTIRQSLDSDQPIGHSAKLSRVA